MIAKDKKRLKRINVGNYAYLEYEICKTYKHNGVLRLPYIMVEYLYTAVEQRNQGHASTLLTHIKTVGDALNLPVILMVEPYGENKPTKQWLRKFYKKHGFEESFFNFMEYKPRSSSGNLPMAVPPSPSPLETNQQEIVVIPTHPSLDTQFYEAA